jgi:3-hydroxybutyryl-CoA dehydrogenase
MLDKYKIVGVVGAGAMGSGIAQVAASAGCKVFLYDTRKESVDQALSQLKSTFNKLVEKQKLTLESANEILSRITPSYQLSDFVGCNLVIEAIVENLSIKQQLFKDLESVIESTCILASNTSSLSITAIAAACENSSRVIGLHFFNPAPLMPLVEIIPAVQTNENLSAELKQLMLDWKKVPVLAKDTPGFIVNRVARPFYGESLRICEEGIASKETIDWALKEIGGFKMGPFELMDLIGNDINYTVTETVWTQSYFDPRYKPSIIQKKMVESKRFGRKSGIGYYDYHEGAVNDKADLNYELANLIFDRVIVMLINEAADAFYYQIASENDIDLAMTKGVNYPKGLLLWANELGIINVVNKIDKLYNTYHDDRYRTSVLLRKFANENKLFFS